VQYLKDFATDPFSSTLYDKVMTAFPDLKEVELEVEDVMAHFHYYYPDISLPKRPLPASLAFVPMSLLCKSSLIIW
jgi:hypothetical protein